jgi:hypothetical protein
MKNKIKRNLLIKTMLIAILVVTFATASTFSGTYAWFVKTMADNTVSTEFDGKMGTVDIEMLQNIVTLTKNDLCDVDNNVWTWKTNAPFVNGTITNKSDIDILLRVRVIAEWVEIGSNKGIPPSTPIVITSSDIIFVKETGLGGTFLVYNPDASFNAKYSKLAPASSLAAGNPVSFGFTIGEIAPALLDNWNIRFTFIAEALQATDNAYAYTNNPTNYTGPVPVTSWALN